MKKVREAVPYSTKYMWHSIGQRDVDRAAGDKIGMI